MVLNAGSVVQVWTFCDSTGTAITVRQLPICLYREDEERYILAFQIGSILDRRIPGTLKLEYCE